jgi:cytochrome b6-f complex iron-sulfur subunit
MENNNSLIEENVVSRRDFLSILGGVGIAISGLMSLLGTMFFLKPTVSYGPPTLFRIGKPEDFKEGSSEIFENSKIIVVKEASGFAAISLVCTHLGCTVIARGAGFECPCHGSSFDSYGLNTGGPAPTPLPWYKVSLAPNGELEIDKSITIPQKTYFNV